MLPTIQRHASARGAANEVSQQFAGVLFLSIGPLYPDGTKWTTCVDDNALVSAIPFISVLLVFELNVAFVVPPIAVGIEQPVSPSASKASTMP
jgi:hypothetical protein